MKTMTLTAKSYADLKPFEMMAKRFGLSVEFADRRKTAALESYRMLAKESRAAAQKAGLTLDDVSVAIKNVRRRNKNACSN